MLEYLFKMYPCFMYSSGILEIVLFCVMTSPGLDQNKRMVDLVIKCVQDLHESFYIKLFKLHFLQEGRARQWHFAEVHDSVSIVLYHKDRDTLVFVRQFRPTVYVHNVFVKEGFKCYEDLKTFTQWNEHPFEQAITLELCAGIVDKDMPVVQVAKAEILEECGYNVPINKIEKITTYRGVGTSGHTSYVFYAEIEDYMKVTDGGGAQHEQEIIQVVYMGMQEAKSLVYDESIAKPAGLLFGLMWFFANRAK